MGDRIGDCDVGGFNKSYTQTINQVFEKINDEISREQSFEEFCKFVETNYHNHGHMTVAKACSSKFIPPKGYQGPMAFSEVSARDPIFWRWHWHIEDVIQSFRDTQLPV